MAVPNPAALAAKAKGVAPVKPSRPTGDATAASPAAPGAAPEPIASNPADFGRVDADGTAWLRTPEGERRVGQYQAGPADEALAHFGARFDALATEATVLIARLSTHPEEAARIRKDAAQLRASLPEASAIGDFGALDAQLADLEDKTHDAEREVAANREERRRAAIAHKEKLAEEAENIAKCAETGDLNWRDAGDRLRTILDEWKTVRGIDRSTDDELWRRYSSARETFNKRRGQHFAELDRNRMAARSRKEQLVEQAEALQNSSDWQATGRAFRDLMSEWKSAGRAHREVDDALWKRFKAAQDTFYAARRAESDKQDAEFEGNAAAKQALIDEYSEKIDPESTGLDRARAALSELQDKWEQIGFVPRGRVSEFEEKIGALEQRVTDAADKEWRRTDPEAQARVTQFRSKAEQLAQEAEQAAVKGNEKKAEQLRAQAAQWQEWADTAAAVLES